MPELDSLTRPEDEKITSNVPYRLLKALLPFYAGRVKCSFIDPPYNTRSTFEHYDDNLERTQWLRLTRGPMARIQKMMFSAGNLRPASLQPIVRLAKE
jgi:adenine-specific DNA-methyltransferase